MDREWLNDHDLHDLWLSALMDHGAKYLSWWNVYHDR